MTIGELAGRLRISPRALRHYESIGLLEPSYVDARTGYRYYGDVELTRGLQIEQLKAAGIPLATITRMLDDGVPITEALEAHQSYLARTIADHRVHLAVVEAMLRAPGGVGAPQLVEVTSVDAMAADAVCSPEQLPGTIRRLVQRLRRRVVRRLEMTPSAYSAMFPLEPAPQMATRVAAHVDRSCAGSVVIEGVGAVAVVVVGPHALLPIAQEVALADVRSRGLEPSGWVWEQYLDLGPLARTRLLVPVLATPAALGNSAEVATYSLPA